MDNYAALTAAQLTSLNPVLPRGEYWSESDTGYTKLGNGATVWTELPYWRVAPPMNRWNVGYFYGPNGTKGTLAATANSEYAGRMAVPPGVAIDGIGVTTTGSGGAGSVARLGVRRDSGKGTPGALILDAGTVAVSDAAGDKLITITELVLPEPFVWLTVATQEGTAATYRSITLSHDGFGDISAANAGDASTRNGYVTGATVTGAFSPTYTVAGGAFTPRVYVRCSKSR